jgi:hypothetical protein
VTVVLEQLRLAAALVHRAPGAELEIRADDRRWIVSRSHPDATFDPCNFRKVVLAAMRANGEPLARVDAVQFVGGLLDIGGGIYQRQGPHGSERRIATLLSVPQLDALLDRVGTEFGDDVVALVQRDPDLAVSVVVVRFAPPASPLRLDAAAHAIAAACLVEELIEFAAGAATI